MKVLISTLLLISAQFVIAQNDDITNESGRKITKGISLMPADSGNKDFLGSIKVSGDARFFTIYRDMQTQYPDQTTASKNLGFLAYPNSGGGNAAGKPFVEMSITAKPSSGSEVSIGYALAHTFTGVQNTFSDSVTRFAQVRNLLNFGGKMNTKYGNFAVQTGGGVLWTRLSPMTMDNTNFRPDNFDRLEWDWYTNSWNKYNDFYNASGALNAQNIGAGLQGFKLSGTALPKGFGIDLMYGRTNQSVNNNKVLANPPSYVLAGKVNKSFLAHNMGVNYYLQTSNTDNINRIVDFQEIVSLEGTFDLKDIKWYTELAGGRVGSPVYTSDGWGLGLISNMIVPSSKFGWPISAQIFGISNDIVSNVGSFLNSNSLVPNGGFDQDRDYTTQLFINSTLETGQTSNNRMGLSAITGKQFGKLRTEIGFGLSQEIENLYDTITFLHHANTFSRSRFNPWFQSAGPYKRVKNVFMRSFEFLSVDPSLGKDYKKGFSSFDLSLNYKTRFLRKEVIIKYFNTYQTIQKGFIPKFGKNAFFQQWYTQLIGFMKMTGKISLVGFYEQERNIGNKNTSLSDYNGLPMLQIGDGFGYGLDYDFSDFAGIYFRHRIMYNQDKNFVKDNFQGQELTFELKVFF